MTLNLFHSRLAITVLLYFVIMMVWAILRFLRNQGIHPNFRGGMIISGLLVLAQGVLGGILWLNDIRPVQGGMHVLYGIIGVCGIPLIFFIRKERNIRSDALIYGIGYLLIVGILVRSIMTG